MKKYISRGTWVILFRVWRDFTRMKFAIENDDKAVWDSLRDEQWEALRAWYDSQRRERIAKQIRRRIKRGK